MRKVHFSIFDSARSVFRASAGSKAVCGFTLLETVVVVGVMAFAIGAVAVLYVNLNTMLGTGAAVQASASDAKRVVGEVELLALQARGVVASRAFSGTTYVSDGDTLVLQLPSVNGSGAVIANTYDYAVVYQSGSTTVRILETGSGSARNAETKKLAGSTATLSFTYDDADPALAEKITVEIATVTVTRGTAHRAQMREAVRLRNAP